MDHFVNLKKFGLIVLGLLTFQAVFSQENYLPGYVIKTDYDTLYGFVDYRNWGVNPERIKFKKNSEDHPILFGPSDIIEFRVHDEIYVSGIIDIEVSPTQIDRLEENSRFNIMVDTAFLQTLFRGKKSLFYYKNADGNVNYYIRQGSGFELMNYKKYLKQEAGKQVIAENKKFIGQLALYLNDCATILPKVEKVSYKQNSLVKLFQDYSECTQSEVYFQKKTEKITTGIGVLAGVSLTSLAFKGNNYDYLVYAGYEASAHFSMGLYFDFVLPRYQQKWSVYNELQYMAYTVNGKYEDFVSENHYSVTTTEIGYSYLKINNMVRFKYPVKDVFLFINAGISNGFSIAERNYKKLELKFYTLEQTTEEPALKETRKYEQAILLGTGVKFGDFSSELRYERGNGMSVYLGLNATTQKFYVLLGYKF